MWDKVSQPSVDHVRHYLSHVYRHSNEPERKDPMARLRSHETYDRHVSEVLPLRQRKVLAEGGNSDDIPMIGQCRNEIYFLSKVVRGGLSNFCNLHARRVNLIYQAVTFVCPTSRGITLKPLTFKATCFPPHIAQKTTPENDTSGRVNN